MVCVDSLALTVDSLKTRLALDTRVANLVRIHAGADVVMGNVDVNLKGVQANALVLIDLSDVVHVTDQTLTFIDKHPEVVPRLQGASDSALASTRVPHGTAHPDSARTRRLRIIGTMHNAAGETVQRLVNLDDGEIFERTLAPRGARTAERSVGNVVSLPPVAEPALTADGTLNRVRDPSGAVLTFVEDARGGVGQVTVQAPNTAPRR
jgi:hypothetical protein